MKLTVYKVAVFFFKENYLRIFNEINRTFLKWYLIVNLMHMDIALNDI